ncbi:MAG: integral rane sensor signal transduction histidine kinase [Verrucomicrobia bacterium]|nr:integral rane sensor signal transduction histidine kinase [Verrucomicrobiota bacterium]
MLRTRLIVGLLPLLLLFMVVCVYAVRTSQDLGDSVEAIFARTFRSIGVVQQLRESAAQMNAALGEVRQGGDLAAARKRFLENRSRFKQSMNDELLAQPGAGKAELLNALDDEFQEFTSAGNETLRLGPLGGLDLLKDTETSLFAVNRSLDILLQRDRGEIFNADARMKSRIDEALRLLVAAMVGAVVLFFFLAWRLANSFLQPIRAITASAVALGGGDLNRTVPVTSSDELGQLARAFNAMAAHLRAYRDATLAKVLRTQRTMEATLTSTPEPVFVVDRDGTHEVRNPAAEQLAQSPDFANGFPKSIAEPLNDVLTNGAHYLPTDYSHVVTFRVAREDRHYLPRILAIGDKLTEFKGAAIILQDVTKFRLLDDAKTNLVGTVSHELKSPLTSVRMAIYLLLEQSIPGLTPTQRELLETARDDADRLLRILDNLLDLARIEAGASTLDCQDARISKLLSEVATEARGLAEAAGVALVVQVDRELEEESVHVDAMRIRHVFINLLSNAVKYSPPAGVITLGVAVAPLGFIRFAVTDQGAGIPSDVIPHVFERFYRAPGQEKTGAGLGLAIAREIVVAHGGSISCTSVEGQGTTFSFMLPK